MPTAMTLRRKSWWFVAAVSLITAIMCAMNHAWISFGLTLACVGFGAWKLRQPVPHVENLKDWLIALEGKDPFNPDAKPNYEWRGFATTFVVALRVDNHPILTGQTLLVFRDEVEADNWRKLVTRVRHGAHAHASHAKKRKRFRKFFE
jgi:hypothetical protein